MFFYCAFFAAHPTVSAALALAVVLFAAFAWRWVLPPAQITSSQEDELVELFGGLKIDPEFEPMPPYFAHAVAVAHGWVDFPELLPLPLLGRLIQLGLVVLGRPTTDN